MQNSEISFDPSLSQLLARPTELLLELEKVACEESLVEFIKAAWHVVEPGQPYIHNWHIDAIADHLEAMDEGVEIDGNIFNRFLANVPPGLTKSLVITVFFPAWVWGPRKKAWKRFLCAAHAQDLSIRDSMRCRRLVSSEWYQHRWGEQVTLSGDQNAKTKFENTSGGFRQAVAAGSITGARGDYVLIDDPNSVEGAASDAMRASTNEWFLEAVPTRLNNPISSCIIVIMQRLHEEDVSGTIISKGLGYEHLMLPMEFEPDRRCVTGIGFVDPREEEGELLFPERFPREVVDRDKNSLGSYASAGQFQQRPEPRGGGIIKRGWWLLWDKDTALQHGCDWIEPQGKYPTFEYIITVLDTAYTEKEENDPSACTTWGIWRDRHGRNRVMLIHAWSDRLELNALVEKAAKTCTKWKSDRLLIEAKASGLSVAQEIRRLHSREDWTIQTIDPGRLDKVARAYQVTPMFERGMVYAPERAFADSVISQCSTFPKGAHDDYVDTTTMALSWFRTTGMLVMDAEAQFDEREAMVHRTGRNAVPLYPT